MTLKDIAQVIGEQDFWLNDTLEEDSIFCDQATRPNDYDKTIAMYGNAEVIYLTVDGEGIMTVCI